MVTRNLNLGLATPPEPFLTAYLAGKSADTAYFATHAEREYGRRYVAGEFWPTEVEEPSRLHGVEWVLVELVEGPYGDDERRRTPIMSNPFLAMD